MRYALLLLPLSLLVALLPLRCVGPDGRDAGEFAPETRRLTTEMYDARCALDAAEAKGDPEAVRAVPMTPAGGEFL